jgi:Haemolysin-type calcium binding protein related domain.
MQDEGTVVEEIRFGDGTVWNVEAIRDRLLTGGEESEILRGFYGRDDHLVGGGGDDLLLGGVGDDLLEGGAGDDELWGDGFDDWGYLYHVCEGHGGDRYLIGRGEGHDVIHEYRWGGGTDQLIFGDGILPESVNVAVEPSQGSTGTWDLVLTLADGGSVRLVEQFDDGELLPAVEEVLFADGTLWDADRMAELAGYQRMEAYWLDPYAPA